MRDILKKYLGGVIYTSCLFSKDLIRAKLKQLDDSQNYILPILKTVITQKGLHMNKIRLRHIRKWRNLLMPCSHFFRKI